MALTLDAHGNPLEPGDTVRQIQFGEHAKLRTVEAVGRDHLASYILVSGFLGWHAARLFEKV